MGMGCVAKISMGGLNRKDEITWDENGDNEMEMCGCASGTAPGVTEERRFEGGRRGIYIFFFGVKGL